MTALKPQYAKAIELCGLGLSALEIASQMGYTERGIKSILRRHGVAAPAKKRKTWTRQESPEATRKMKERSARAEKMAAMYRQGITLGKIGQHFGGLTRERVRQILKASGIKPGEGVRAAKKENTESVRIARKDARSLTLWGVPDAERDRYRKDGTLSAFTQQRTSAKSRGIAWKLMFSQWIAIWDESGKLPLRGVGAGKYCMSRIKDEGGYVTGNVHIQSASENNREGIKKCRHNRANNTGVWLMYPGLAKGWLAHVGRVSLGLFATEADGVAARQAYLDEHPAAITQHRGRGYTIIKGKKTPRYQVVLGGRYIGTFQTPEAALFARAEALAALARPTGRAATSAALDCMTA